MRRDRIILIVLSSVLALISLAGALNVHARGKAGPEAATRIYGGNFRYPISEPTSLDPVDDGADWAILGQIFDGLVKYDVDHEPIPAIAQSWTSTDAITWTFTIRSGARFHNGRQITAHDVVQSWLRAEKTSDYWYLMDMAGLSSYLALDASTFQVVLNGPFAPFPYIVGLPPFSVVPPEELATIDTSPVGSGPFVFQSWTGGSQIVLTANNGYYGGRPYLDRLTFPFYANTDDMYNAFLAKSLDFSPVPPAYQDGLIGDPDVITVSKGTSYFGMKVDLAPFDDVRVRQALNYAVDKQDIVDNVLDGYQVVADGFTPPGMQGYDPAVQGYDYDPTEALDLLAQAGWTDTDDDGILDDGLGTDLTIEMWHSTRPGHAAIAAAAADDLRHIGGTSVGATVTISDTDWGTYIANLDNYPMYTLQWFWDYPEPFDFLDPIFRSTSGNNYSHYNNSSVDTGLDQAKETLDGSTRRALYATAESQIQQDAPHINLYYYISVYIQQPWVEGLTMPMEIPRMEKVWLTSNRVSNGSFERGPRIPAAWKGSRLTSKDRRVCTTAHDGSCSFKMVGTTANKSLKQVVNISGSAGDTFTLSGWSKAQNPLPKGGPYCLEAKVYHTDGTKGTYRACFAKSTHGWQFRKKTFTIAKNYNKIVVSLLYYNQGGKAWFDDVWLIKK